MSVLGNLFGKDEINQLKGELIYKSNEISKLDLVVANLKLEIVNVNTQLSDVKKENAAAQDARDSLTIEIEQCKSDFERVTSDFESFRNKSLEQQEKLKQTIAELQTSLSSLAPEVAAANAERDAKDNELQRLRSAYDEKDRSYVLREAKLSEKSEKLLQDRQKFQQQAMDLHAREQHWKHVVEPQICKYESHLILDLRQKQLDEQHTKLDALERSITDREADMVRRQLIDQVLTSREVEISEWNQLLSDRAKELKSKTDVVNQEQEKLDALSKQLDANSRELSVFRVRVDQLDEEAAQLKIRAENIQVKEDCKTRGTIG